MSEEENNVLEYFKNNQIFDIEVAFNYIPVLLNIIEGLQTKVDTGIEIIKELKEIEQAHKTDNGLLRQELDMQIEHNKELEATLKQTQDSWFEDTQKLEQEKEKNKELEEHQRQYLDGELITAKQGKFFEKMIKENYIRKDKLKAIQGQLCMQLGSYVRDEASPEQERIAGGINIINEILEGE